MSNLFKKISEVIGDVGEFQWNIITGDLKDAFSSAYKVWSSITPWNDNTPSGKLLNIAAIALLTYGAGSYFGTGAETTAGALATESGVAASSGGASTVTTPTLTGGAVNTGSNLVLPSATNTSGTSLLTNLTTFAKEHPILTSTLVGGGMSAIGGAMSAYGAKEAAKEQAKTQKEIQERMLSYGGSFATSDRKIDFPSQKMELPKVTYDIINKLQTDVEYRKGFSTAAAKILSGKNLSMYETFYDQMKSSSIFR